LGRAGDVAPARRGSTGYGPKVFTSKSLFLPKVGKTQDFFQGLFWYSFVLICTLPLD